MKKSIALCFCLFTISFISRAQKFVPDISVGTIISATGTLGDNDFSVKFTVLNLEGSSSLSWEVDNYGEGSFEMTREAMQSATALYLKQPNPGKITLNDNETFLIISKAAFSSIINDGTFTYNNIKFILKADGQPVRINNKETDAFYLEANNGKATIWILNNPAFPLIVKSNGLPTDIVINDIINK